MCLIPEELLVDQRRLILAVYVALLQAPHKNGCILVNNTFLSKAVNGSRRHVAEAVKVLAEAGHILQVPGLSKKLSSFRIPARDRAEKAKNNSALEATPRRKGAVAPPQKQAPYKEARALSISKEKRVAAAEASADLPLLPPPGISILNIGLHDLQNSHDPLALVRSALFALPEPLRRTIHGNMRSNHIPVIDAVDLLFELDIETIMASLLLVPLHRLIELGETVLFNRKAKNPAGLLSTLLHSDLRASDLQAVTLNSDAALTAWRVANGTVEYARPNQHVAGSN